MASAIAHTHFTAHKFHMDIKPANFVLDSNQNLILIDWEQSGAPLYTLAPEANGSWDVKEAKVESSSSDGADYGKNGGYDCGVCHGTGQV
jgi:serine/threonine protein kinase